MTGQTVEPRLHDYSPRPVLPKLADMPDDPTTDSRSEDPKHLLTIRQTATGYWSVQRGSVQLAFAMTRTAAEHERETLQRISRCSQRRAGRRHAVQA